MYRPQSSRIPAPRRGIILLIVLVMLTLFAIVGLTFVFYADSQAQGTRIAREAVNVRLPEVDPEDAFALFLNQLIYDQADDTGVESALRGHSLLRNMYGYNDGGTNTGPFIGTGRLSEPITFFPNTPQAVTVDSYDLINYMCFANPNGTYIDTMKDSFGNTGGMRDAERLGVRTGSSGNLAGRGLWTGGFNAGYNYADNNSMFLAAVKADGTVLAPSFYRPGAPFGLLDPNKNSNWYANSPGKYMILRPRPVDNITQAQATAAGLPYPVIPENLSPAQLAALPGIINNLISANQLIPYPDDTNGDVKNLLGTANGNDSIWIDIGAPVMTMADGRKFKMLFAPLIMDLDGKLNVNAHGNIRGFNPATRASPNLSLSNEGWGPWEVSLARALSALDASNNYEWTNLFLGKLTGPVTMKWGKYGPNGLPTNATSSAPSGSGAPYFYASVDYDSGNDGQGGVPTNQITLPTVGGASPPPYSSFLTYPLGYGNNSGVEGVNHPLLYNAYKNALYNANNDDYVFQASNLAALLRYGDTGSEFLSSDLLTLCPVNFANPRSRRMVTTHSFDVNLPGGGPWVYDYKNPASSFVLNFTPAVFGYPVTAGVSTLVSGARTFPAYATRAAAPPVGSSFATDWRWAPLSIAANSVSPASFSFDGSKRYDLNQAVVNLPAYPAANALTGVIDLTMPANVTQLTKAMAARTDMAAQIYYRLILATGAFDPFSYRLGNPALTPGDIQAMRYLAQLAVNIVDYLDRDDFITPFNWGTYGSTDFFSATGTGTANNLPLEWVYGTELPRLVLNEAYAEFVNDPTDPGLKLATPAATRYTVNVWAELQNPFNNDPNLVDPSTGALSVARLQNFDQTMMTATTPVYQILITPPNLHLRDPNNPLGNPDGAPAPNYVTTFQGNTQSGVSTWAPPGKLAAAPASIVVYPTNNNYASPTNQSSNVTFYMVGPTTSSANYAPYNFPNDPVMTAKNGMKLVPPAPTFLSPTMTFNYVLPNGMNNTTLNAPPTPTLILQRLACPYLPANPLNAAGQLTNPGLPYNPYVTVDYIENLFTNNNLTTPPAGAIPPGNNQAPQAVAGRWSFGKAQPYAANTLLQQKPQLAADNTTMPPIAANGGFPNQPQHSFFQANCAMGTAANVDSTTTANWAQNTAPADYNPAFNWLTHLDRPMVSTMELLQVSGFKPHELTQQFMPGFNHRASWYDPNLKVYRSAWLDPTLGLYRFFDWIQTTPLAAGASANGRVAGRININNVWDLEILLGLCDPQTSSFFAATDVSNIFTQMVNQRTPTGTPSPADRPFRSLATGTFAGTTLSAPCAAGNQTVTPAAMKGVAGGVPWSIQPGSTLIVDTGATQEVVVVTAVAPPVAPTTFTATFSQAHGMGAAIAVPGIENTILRTFAGGNGSATRLFQGYSVNPATASHPYTQSQLLTKIFNNVTVRSNVFAIWATVGFFEVTDDTTFPVKLGAEIGRSENKHVRHRMLAIVDRTSLSLATTTSSTGVVLNVVNGNTQPTPVTVTPAAMNGTTANGFSWSIGVGSVLNIVDPTGNPETVTVTAVTAGSFTATFQNAHSGTYTIAIPGNPGPQARFNPHSPPDTGSVLYFSIID